MQPDNNPAAAPASAPTTTPMNPGGDIVFKNSTKKSKGMIVGMVILAILAIGGTAFGVWAYLDGNSRVAKKDEIINELNSKASGLSQYDDSDIETIDEGAESEINTANCIYVGEWGLKIKIPESLSSVSYRYSQEAGYTKVTIWGVDCSNGRCQYFPDYANVNSNISGMGSITRYPKGTTFNEASEPTLVFSDENYDYYQYHPQVAYTVDNPSDEAQWEMDGIKIIEEILSNTSSYSKI